MLNKESIIILVFSCVMFSLGWTGHKYYTGYQSNLEQQIVDKVTNLSNKVQIDISSNFEDMKENMNKTHVEIVEKEVPYIVEKEVYKNVCFDESGVALLNKLKEDAKLKRKESIK